MNRIIAVVLLVMASAMVFAATPRWETVNSPVTGQALSEIAAPGAQERFDVDVRDGYVYVGFNRPTTVKVFTILGQLINQESLPAGVHRLKMSAKGIYIVKTDWATRRVTI